MSSLPAPLVPAEVDLTGFHWFPLKHKRLRESEWWVAASDFARSRNVDLWVESYLQVPAASLPDSDAKLAEMSGFGRDVAGFRATKDELMAAWVLCADGRWYHPTLAEVAKEAWQQKLDEIAARDADAARKRAARVASSGRPADVQRTSSGRDDEDPDAAALEKRPRQAAAEGVSSGRPPDVPRTSGGKRGDVQRTSAGKAAMSDRTSVFPPDPPLEQSTSDRRRNPPPPLAGGSRCPSDVRWTGSAAEAAWQALPVASRSASSPDQFAAAWAVQVEAGETDDGLLRAAEAAGKHFAAEGTRRAPAAHRWLTLGRFKAFLPKPPPPRWAGPPEIRAEVVAHIGAEGETFAQMCLDQGAGWSDVPRAVLCATGYTHDKLTRRCGSIFRKHGVEILRKERAA